MIWALCLGACDSTPNPQEVEGAVAYMARAIEHDDPAALFRVVDERARHAMISIVADRRAAAALIRAAYPPEVKDDALEELGDAATVETAAALFALRCGAACRQALGERLGPPTSERDEGDERVVTTSRGGTVRLYRAQPGHWWGFVWETEALDRERSRANRDLRHIERNVEIYRRRMGLAAPNEPSPSSPE
ncbi:MAG: hypothetical protein KF901_06210 [Myxococcales bacterium]|nr:hypothetical protein [Myxococcales bacterium]